MLYRPGDVNRLYYGTDTRAQSIMVGAALAVVLSLWADRRRRADGGPTAPRGASPPGGDPAWAARTVGGRAALLLVGLLGAGGSVALWLAVSANDAFAYRGGFLLAALTTAAVIASVVCVQRSVLARCLSVAPVRYLGRISYGMYLWHFPLFLYLDGSRTGLVGLALFALRFVATLVMATLSFYLVERPVRQGTFLSGWKVWVATPAAMAAAAAAVLVATALPTVALGAGASVVDTPAPSPPPAASSWRAGGPSPHRRGLHCADPGDRPERPQAPLRRPALRRRHPRVRCHRRRRVRGAGSRRPDGPPVHRQHEHPAVAAAVAGRPDPGPAAGGHDPGGTLGGGQPHLREPMDEHREPPVRGLRPPAAGAGGAGGRLAGGARGPAHGAVLRQRRTARRSAVAGGLPCPPGRLQRVGPPGRRRLAPDLAHRLQPDGVPGRPLRGVPRWSPGA